MRVYILLEGNSDEGLLRRLIPSELLRETTIVIAGGRSNITSMARSLMVTKQRPLVMIVDADTVETAAVEQRLKTLEELIGSAAAGVPCKVILAVPEIESWLFELPDLLERLSGKRLSPEQRAFAKTRPKEVLSQLFKDDGLLAIDKIASQLTEPEVQTLRETQPTRELLEFLMEQVCKNTEPQVA